MAGKLRDITGMTFGRLKAIRRDGKGSPTKWMCLCQCGKSHVVTMQPLVEGRVKSCGCLQKDRIHRMIKSPEYNTWASMRSRCRNETRKEYPAYGGRGITYCERWESFKNFYEDMGERPEGYSIERIDVNGDYEPDNCEWIPLEDQCLNTRKRKIMYNGKRIILAREAAKLNISRQALHQRLKTWPLEKALTTVNPVS